MAAPGAGGDNLGSLNPLSFLMQTIQGKATSSEERSGSPAHEGNQRKTETNGVYVTSAETTLPASAGDAGSGAHRSSVGADKDSSVEMAAQSTSSPVQTQQRRAFVKPKMTSHGRMGTVSDDYLTDRKARLERIRKQMVQKNKRLHVEGEEFTEASMMYTKANKQPARNVFTRLEEPAMKTGPFSILHRAMTERKKVRVWTRNYKHVRGICTGMVIIYDKHFNMALVDVDEIYRNPLKTTIKAKKKRRRKRKEKKEHSQNKEGDCTRGTDPEDKPDLKGTINVLKTDSECENSSTKKRDSECENSSVTKRGSDCEKSSMLKRDSDCENSSAMKRGSDSDNSSGSESNNSEEDIEDLTAKLKQLRQELEEEGGEESEGQEEACDRQGSEERRGPGHRRSDRERRTDSPDRQAYKSTRQHNIADKREGKYSDKQEEKYGDKRDIRSERHTRSTDKRRKSPERREKPSGRRERSPVVTRNGRSRNSPERLEKSPERRRKSPDRRRKSPDKSRDVAESPRDNSESSRSMDLREKLRKLREGRGEEQDKVPHSQSKQGDRGERMYRDGSPRRHDDRSSRYDSDRSSRSRPRREERDYADAHGRDRQRDMSPLGLSRRKRRRSGSQDSVRSHDSTKSHDSTRSHDSHCSHESSKTHRLRKHDHRDKLLLPSSIVVKPSDNRKRYTTLPAKELVSSTSDSTSCMTVSQNAGQKAKYPGGTETKDCGSQSDTTVPRQSSMLERHVSQLFIRGDNVVMVSFA